MIDTAGIREHSVDVIEMAGIEKSYEKMRSADVILYIYDVNEMDQYELTEIGKQFEKVNKKYILAGNKVDAINTHLQMNNMSNRENSILISAKNNVGIEEIKNALFALTVNEQPVTESVVVTNARHYEALQQVYTSLMDIKAGLDNTIPADLLALDIRRCLHYISEITGGHIQ